MNKFIQTKVAFDKTDENGLVKQVKETVLIDALSFTEAEAKVIEFMQEYYSGSIELLNMSKPNYSEVFLKEENNDIWFEVHVKFEHLQENGKTRVEKHKMLVNSTSIKEALEDFNKFMNGTLVDYTIIGIKETSITDVFTLSDSIDLTK